MFKGHWAARSCAKQSKGEENPAIHLSLSVLFMLYSPLCLILYGQQQLDVTGTGEKGTKVVRGYT